VDGGDEDADEDEDEVADDMANDGDGDVFDISIDCLREMGRGESECAQWRQQGLRRTLNTSMLTPGYANRDVDVWIRHLSGSVSQSQSESEAA